MKQAVFILKQPARIFPGSTQGGRTLNIPYYKNLQVREVDWHIHCSTNDTKLNVVLNENDPSSGDLG